MPSKVQPSSTRPRRTGARLPRPLLPAKVVRPEAIDAVERPRLFRRLDQFARRPVTGSHAPAGAGKTVLLTSYAAAGGAKGLL